MPGVTPKIVYVPSAPVVAVNPPVSVDTVAPGMGTPRTEDTTSPVMAPVPVGGGVGVTVGVVGGVDVGVAAADVTKAVSVTVELRPLASGLSVNVTVNVSPTSALMFVFDTELPVLTFIVPRNDPVSLPVSVTITTTPVESVLDLMFKLATFAVVIDVFVSLSASETMAFPSIATESEVISRAAPKFFVLTSAVTSCAGAAS